MKENKKELDIYIIVYIYIHIYGHFFIEYLDGVFWLRVSNLFI